MTEIIYRFRDKRFTTSKLNAGIEEALGKSGLVTISPDHIDFHPFDGSPTLTLPRLRGTSGKFGVVFEIGEPLTPR